MYEKLFEHLLDSEIETGTIHKIRDLVLDLAIMGRIAPQQSQDKSPLSKIEMFAKERLELVKKKELPKAVKVDDIKIDDVQFEPPSGWVWCHFQDILALDRYAMKRGPFGSSIRKGDFVKSGVRVFEQFNPINDDPHWMRYFLTNEKAEELANFYAGPGDYLVSCSGTLGRICRLPEDTESGIINQALLKLKINLDLISSDYFLYLFRSNYFQRIILNKSQGLAQSNMIGVRELKVIHIPLPPLNEQSRIVKKLDEFMQILDSLEKTILERDKKLVKLRESSHLELSEAKDEQTFRMVFQLITDNSEYLYQSSQDLSFLRRAVLNFAFRGKLTPQIYDDEPVTQLLDRILKQKNEQIENGVIAKPKSFTKLSEIGEPYLIPKNWKWSQLGRECLVVMGNSPKSTSYNNDEVGIPLINGPVEFSKEELGPTLAKKYTTAPTSKMCQIGDLIVCVRASTGRTNIAAFDACIGRGVGLIRGYDAQDYVNLYMLWIGSELRAAGKGMIFSSLTYDDLASWPIPFPPLEEAYRIIDRVRGAFDLSDKLERALSTQKDIRGKLIQGLIRDTLVVI